MCNQDILDLLLIFWRKKAFPCKILMFFRGVKYKFNIFAGKSVYDRVLTVLCQFIVNVLLCYVICLNVTPDI